LGTFNNLDGEMIEIDHQFYQIKADGIAYQVPDEMKAPFAVVTWFGADQTIISDKPMNWDQLLTYLDSVLPTENIPFAIKIEGTFDYMKTRSVPRQNQPYPRLLEVLKTQPVFEFHQVEGVMAGFRLPDYVQGLNAPGYHFHFITKNKDAGGHVLTCQTRNLKIEIDYTDQWHLLFPHDEEFYHFNMTEDKYQ
ncbi:MAG: acetolactate decarboxylase, partial [bacterium]